jgi:hypothetical protein
LKTTKRWKRDESWAVGKVAGTRENMNKQRVSASLAHYYEKESYDTLADRADDDNFLGRMRGASLADFLKPKPAKKKNFPRLK